jgi:hypothetical protein
VLEGQAGEENYGGRADVDIDAIPDFLRRTKIDRFNGKIVTSSSLTIWLDSNWSGLFGYRPKFHTLAYGWICFNFKSKEDLT